MTKIVICGANGKMGQTIYRCIKAVSYTHLQVQTKLHPTLQYLKPTV